MVYFQNWLGKQTTGRLGVHFNIAHDISQKSEKKHWKPRFYSTKMHIFMTSGDPKSVTNQVTVDVLVLSSGGNLLDSLSLALCAVLSETLLPKAVERVFFRFGANHFVPEVANFVGFSSTKPFLVFNQSYINDVKCILYMYIFVLLYQFVDVTGILHLKAVVQVEVIEAMEEGEDVQLKADPRCFLRFGHERSMGFLSFNSLIFDGFWWFNSKKLRSWWGWPPWHQMPWKKLNKNRPTNEPLR